MAAAVAAAVVSPDPRLPVLRPRDSWAKELSRREVEVLYLAGEGLSNADIGAALGIATDTVKRYVHSAMAKTRTTSRTGAVVFAYKWGYLDLELDAQRD